MSATSPLRVLIVDDCPDNRDSLALLVRAWGHEVCVAHDGPSALEAFRAFHPRTVLLDIAMPGQDGWAVARQIRAEQGTSRLLLIAVTGHGRERDRARSREAGLDVHLTKPANLNELRLLLEEAAASPLEEQEKTRARLAATGS